MSVKALVMYALLYFLVKTAFTMYKLNKALAEQGVDPRSGPLLDALPAAFVANVKSPLAWP